jgi:hypothetical protein
MANTVTRLTSNGVFQASGMFDEVSLNSGSIYFNGSTDYLEVPDNSALELGSGNFTFEAWVYLTGYSPSYNAYYIAQIFNKDSGSTTRSINFFIGGTSSTWTTIGCNLFSNGTTLVTTSATFSFQLGTWYHVAAVRSGTSLRLYVNGVDVGGGTNSINIQDNSSPFQIGAQSPYWTSQGYGYFFTGYISNARVVKGTAVYTANFTPPTSPLLPIANTQLLLSTNPQTPFVDSSTNNFAITKNGTPKFNTLGPFYFPGNTSINLANTNNTPNIGSNTNIVCSTTSGGIVMPSGGINEVLPKNLLTYSQNFTNAIWFTAGNTSVTANAYVAPDGTTTATRLQFLVASSGTYLYVSYSLLAGITYTFSIYVRTDSAFPNFNIAVDASAPLGAGTYLASTNIVANSVWTRYSVSYKPVSSGTYSIGLDNQTNSLVTDVYIWGAQLEIGPQPTFYGLTTGTAAIPTNGFVGQSITTTGNLIVNNYFDELNLNTNQISVSYLVVAGGGGGGENGGGGGGAGGFLTGTYNVTKGTQYNIIVGAGGIGGTAAGAEPTNGANSSFASITAIGGGASTTTATGYNGGSGGGFGSYMGLGTPGNGIPGQGNSGGIFNTGSNGSSGGGGAGGPGGNAVGNDGGNGGIGLFYPITGKYYAGGGGGGPATTGISGLGGLGGGGDSSNSRTTKLATSGATNTGGGGGGTDGDNGISGTYYIGANGGSGIVIIAWPNGLVTPANTTGNVTIASSNTGYQVYSFTSNGSITF